MTHAVDCSCHTCWQDGRQPSNTFAPHPDDTHDDVNESGYMLAGEHHSHPYAA